MKFLIWLSAAALKVVALPSYDEADSRLNGAYVALEAHLPAQERLKLREAQRSWIVARNRTCGREARNSCAIKMSLERSHALESAMLRASYKSFSVQQLLRLERQLDDVCRGYGEEGDGPVCTRREAVYNELGRRGWCWGSSKPGTFAEADMYWLPCRNDRTNARPK